MLATFVIGLREGLEAALIVGIIAAFLRKNGRSLTAMWVGVALAVLLSIAVGVALDIVEKALPQAAQEGMETVIGAIAVFFVTGAGLGVWGLVYTGTSLFLTFLITAAAFGGLSLFGYTTKKDLTGFGSFLIMGVVGLLIASVVNMFLHMAALAFIVNILGVLIFAGLVAYDTQRLKMTYYQLGGDQQAMSVATNYGALSLYINFINLFQFLLSMLGSRR